MTDRLAEIINSNTSLAPLLAVIAGIVTAFSPCCLSSVPLVMGYIGGVGDRSIGKSFKLSLMFSLGMVLTSTILGVLAALLGTLLQIYYSGGWWYVVLGVLMLFMAFQVWEFVKVVPSTFFVSKSTRRGYTGACITGALAGIFSSPCSTPVLVVLLAIVANQGDVAYGAFLLFLYSTGHCVLFLIVGTFTSYVKRVMYDSKYGILSSLVKWVSGGVILLAGVYFIYLGI